MNDAPRPQSSPPPLPTSPRGAGDALSRTDAATLTRTTSAVAIGRRDGLIQNHQLTKFSPFLTVLPVARGKSDMLLPIDEVAYVAFLSVPGEPPRAASPEATTVKIHVPGGKIFTVLVPLTEGDTGAGFYAYPVVPGPFRELFFYDHAVTRKERIERIGELLVQDGVASAADVQRGLDAKSAPIGQILIEQQKVNAEVIAAAVTTQARTRMRLGEVLIEAGLATAKDIDLALAEQKTRKGAKLGEVLISLGVITEQDLAMTLAKKFHLPFVDLEELSIDAGAALEIPRDLIARYRFLPVSSTEQSFTVAIADPLFTEVNDILRFHLRTKSIQELVVVPSQLNRFVDRFLNVGGSEPEGEKLDQIMRKLAGDGLRAAIEPAAAEQVQVRDSDSAIIQLANQIIVDAFRRGASDVHIEPNGAQQPVRIRFRIDGDCLAYKDIPAGYRAPLVARLKIMAGLDISERRKPQDGKIRMRVSAQQEIELRVATLPVSSSDEDVVLRILANSKPQPLDKLTLSERNLRELSVLIEKPYGLLLCVGPTGSGKTTTLHSILGALNTLDRKIWTAEDPVEITQPGLRQLQVQPKIGLTFATAMRAFLRADPDVIMVGEMRDEETAGTAVEASLTGHLVLSTLHTNTAPETVTRLLDMGLDPFSFADALLGTLAQRLARKICAACREPYDASEAEQQPIRAALGEIAGAADGKMTLWRGRGCEQCGGTGYKGRVALHELLVSSDEMKQAIQKKASVSDLRQIAVAAGMTTLLQDGAGKAMQGLTDFRQVLAVCSR